MDASRKIRCYCDNEVEFVVPEVIDLAAEPRAEAQILSGDFLSVRCDKCGKLLKPEFSARIVDSARKLELLLAPELDRDHFLMGKAEYTMHDSERGRIVFGYLELV